MGGALLADDAEDVALGIGHHHPPEVLPELVPLHLGRSGGRQP
ncbi:hypothetical protein MMEU_3114 [Mycobacterium marinum str. Europe]|nr:hypothetical protein MMEU_3114 [Mycobacterium marinum str. Europe]